MNATIIVIPTYNERQNIEALIPAIHRKLPDADILVVDDSSPDGTGEFVAREAKRDSHLHLLSRSTKDGLGRAYVAGFQWALKRRYRSVISMDADFSHDPKHLPALVAAAGPDRIVIGSRYVSGGAIEGWGRGRYLNSWAANVVARFLLGIRARDASAGFKCYPRQFLERLDFNEVIASGYAFQVEMLMKAGWAGFKLVEVPITFTDRRVGESKIAGEAVRSILIILRLASQRRGARQLTKFAIVGFVNMLVDWAVYFLLSRPLSVGKLSAKILSFIVSASNSYILNRRWTFRSTNRAIAREFSKFLTVSLIGLVLNAGIFWIVVTKLGLIDVFGLLAATIGVAAWNFLVNKYWTFRPEA